MKSKILPALFSCVVVFAFTGCTTTITRGEPTVVSTGIDQKDWNDAAATMMNSLRDNFINSDKLQSPPNKLALLAISRIVNNTDVRVDTDMLVKKIRVDLLKTGKVVTSTTIGGEDPIAEEEQRRARLLGIEPNRPNYTLSGKIIEQVLRAGHICLDPYLLPGFAYRVKRLEVCGEHSMACGLRVDIFANGRRNPEAFGFRV